MQQRLAFTLDTNCIIAADESRPEAAAIRCLADAHACGKADVAVVAIMASERQRSGQWLEGFQTFEARLAQLGLGHLGLCYPMAYWDISFWDHSLWSGPAQQDLEKRIHDILFPTLKFTYDDFCKVHSKPTSTVEWDAVTHVWRNAKCDVQAIWGHINARRDVFVTSDKNFHRSQNKKRLLELGARRIEDPDAAAALVF